MHPYLNKTALLLALVAGLAPLAATAADHRHLGWDLEAASLLGAQDPANVASLATVMASNDNFAHAMAAYAEGQKVTAAVMLRFYYGTPTTYILYRTADKAMLAEAESGRNGHLVPQFLGEIPLAEWDRLFGKLRAYQQPRPTPKTRNNVTWPFGYGAIMHFYENGVSRTVLMAANDIRPVENPDFVNDYLCRTVFSGMHCHPGPKTHEGWVPLALRELKRTSHGEKQARQLLDIFTDSVLSCWKEHPG